MVLLEMTRRGQRSHIVARLVQSIFVGRMPSERKREAADLAAARERAAKPLCREKGREPQVRHVMEVIIGRMGLWAVVFDDYAQGLGGIR